MFDANMKMYPETTVGDDDDGYDDYMPGCKVDDADDDDDLITSKVPVTIPTLKGPSTSRIFLPPQQQQHQLQCMLQKHPVQTQQVEVTKSVSKGQSSKRRRMSDYLPSSVEQQKPVQSEKVHDETNGVEMADDFEHTS